MGKKIKKPSKNTQVIKTVMLTISKFKNGVFIESREVPAASKAAQFLDMGEVITKTYIKEKRIYH